MKKAELAKRQALISHCLELNESGLNRGTSGNISIRHDDGFLISPTSTSYRSLTPEMVSFVHLDGTWTGPIEPSSEWRFHRDIYRAKCETNAIVHAHPDFCTILAIHGKEIPAIHYMIAIFGGPAIRVAPYAIFGSQALSDHVVAALRDRQGCLLDHHGAIAIGTTIEQAFWRAEELETLARQYHGALLLGDPPLLSDRQVQEVIDKMSGYGLSRKEEL